MSHAITQKLVRAPLSDSEVGAVIPGPTQSGERESKKQTKTVRHSPRLPLVTEYITTAHAGGGS